MIERDRNEEDTKRPQRRNAYGAAIAMVNAYVTHVSGRSTGLPPKKIKMAQLAAIAVNAITVSTRKIGNRLMNAKIEAANRIGRSCSRDSGSVSEQ